MNKRGKVLIVSGSAGSGKSTVLSQFKAGVVEPFRFSVSATTRQARAGEKNGVDYLFVTKDEFEKMIENGELLEHAVFNKNYYGTPKGPVLDLIEQGKIVILEIEVDGAEQVMGAFDERDILSVFISPPDYKTLENRLRSRATNTEEDIVERLERAKEELEYSSLYKYILINYDNRHDEITRAIIDLANGFEPTGLDIYCESREALREKFYK